MFKRMFQKPEPEKVQVKSEIEASPKKVSLFGFSNATSKVTITEAPKTGLGSDIDALLMSIGSKQQNAPRRTASAAMASADGFEFDLSAIGATGPTIDQNRSREAKRLGGIDYSGLILTQAEFEAVYAEVDDGGSRYVRVERQALVNLLIDHSRLLNRR